METDRKSQKITKFQNKKFKNYKMTRKTWRAEILRKLRI